MGILNAILAGAMRMSTPYLYAGLGGLLAQHAGVYNFALEGQMISGACAGFFVTFLTGNLFFGALAAVAAGLLFGWFLAFLCIRFGVNQMVTGLGMNILLSGVTAFISRVFNQTIGVTQDVTLDHLIGNVVTGPAKNIPVIGPVFLDQNVMTYLAIVLFLFYAWFIKNTQYGLAIRGVGENPSASQTAGIDVFKYRYLAVTISGGITALGGAFLTLSQVFRFAEDMTGGRGWIAIAAIALGRWNPVGTFFSCLLFGVASALSNQLQVMNTGLPSQFAMMVPYVLTVITLLTIRGSSHGPAALSKPFMKNR